MNRLMKSLPSLQEWVMGSGLVWVLVMEMELAPSSFSSFSSSSLLQCRTCNSLSPVGPTVSKMKIQMKAQLVLWSELQ